MTRRPKILIVDDKPENLVAIETVLRDLDVELIRAYSGNEALRATLHHDFALALLDIQMPEMDGYELAGILREEERTARLPFIFISAVYTDNLNIFKGYERGAFSFITKPFQPEILINKVKFFISIYEQEAALSDLNEELKQKNEDLEAFTYSVSHDLRAPLRAVHSYAMILMEDHEKELSTECMRLTGNITRNAERMASLIESLLEFSRLGKQSIKARAVDVNLLIQEALEVIQATVKKLPEFRIQQDMPCANGDRELLKQVFVNLLSNAIKYSGKKDMPVVEAGAKREGSEVIYHIRDNGSGFDMQYMNKLFGVFSRLHRDTEYEGIGIGLAIVQRIVTRSGGRVWAEGAIDQGATFYVALPAADD
ncbi:MAG: response regulator [Bacteroidetes bacterium]|nr:response regulator [Bacteroidota bacterium]